MTPRQTTVQEAFDRHAETYDRRFSKPPLGTSVRADVWRIADPLFASAQRLLDLGAGTGEDAIHFASGGIHVTAVDVSVGMMTRLRAKFEAAGLASKIDGVVSDMTSYVPDGARFDGLISDFGALNCLRDLTFLRDLSRNALKPGSALVLTSMGLVYPLETAVFLVKGEMRKAFRRLKKPAKATVEGLPLTVHFHSMRSMRRMLGPAFRLERVVGLRAFLPSPGWEHIEDYAPIQWLAPLDRVWCGSRLTATFADHFVSVWRFEP